MKITSSPSTNADTQLLVSGVQLLDRLYRMTRVGEDVFQIDTDRGHRVFVRLPLDRVDDCWAELATDREEVGKGKGDKSVYVIYDWTSPHKTWMLEDRSRWSLPQRIGSFNGDPRSIQSLDPPRKEALWAFLEAASED